MTDEQLTPTVAAELRDEAQGQLDATVALRRTLHEWPEVGNELPMHRAEVLQALEGLPLDITEHTSTSGITALLTGAKPGPTILLRGDMDALPLHEDTGLEFTSRVDAPDARLRARHPHRDARRRRPAARRSRAASIAGRVLFMFQPGEEGHHGARFMLDEGLLDVPALANGTASPVESAFALHITSSLPSGWLTCRGGAAMASADTIHIDDHRQGRPRQRAAPGGRPDPRRLRDRAGAADDGHPHASTCSTRRWSPSPASPRARPTTSSPRRRSIEGTIRSVSEATRTRVHDNVRRVADGIAAAHGVEARVEIVSGYPVTINDDDVAETALAVATDIAGAERGGAPAPPDHGRRGLQLRAAAGARAR